jgi:creatinine amidohydrolase
VGDVRLEEATWKDVEGYLEKADGLIVPVGTCEQHGLHLPLATDALIAEAFAVALSEATGVALAPTLAYGANLPCDRFVPGTAGFSFDSLRGFTEDALGDWARQGFRHFFIVTAHGCALDGYGFAHHEAIKQGALPLLTGGDVDVRILFPYWVDISDILTCQDSVEHACEAETSLALHLFPDLVRLELARDAEEDEGARFNAFPEGIGLKPPQEGWNGAEGHPTCATAEKGRLIFERCLNALTEHVSDSLSGEKRS